MFSLISGRWGKDVAKEGNVWAAREERGHEDVGEGMRKSNTVGEKGDSTQSTLCTGAGCCGEGALT